MGWKFWEKKDEGCPTAVVSISVDTTTPSETKKVAIRIEADAPYDELLAEAKKTVGL